MEFPSKSPGTIIGYEFRNTNSRRNLDWKAVSCRMFVFSECFNVIRLESGVRIPE